MKRSTRRVLIAFVVVIALFVGWFFYQLFGPNPAIIVSKETTWLTEPLADDGLPDYAKWLLDKQREGVTPENNGAVPLLEAMWPAYLDASDQQIICNELGMPLPLNDGIKEPEYDTSAEHSVHLALAVQLLTEHGLKPDREITTESEFDAWSSEWREARQEVEESSDSSETIGGDLLADINNGFTPIDPYNNWDAEPFETAKEVAGLMLAEANERPWTAEQLPPLADWVQRNGKNFDLLHEAAGRSHFYLPSASMLAPDASIADGIYPNVQAVRSAAKALIVRSMYHLGRDDHLAAWRDCRAVYEIADRAADDTLVGQLVSVACHSIANEVTRSILASHTLPPTVALDAYSFFANSRPERISMFSALTSTERLFFLSVAIQASGHGGPTDEVEILFRLDELIGEDEVEPLSPDFSYDWNIVLEDINKYFDESRAAMNVTQFADRQAALDQLESEYDVDAMEPVNRLLIYTSRPYRSTLLARNLISIFPSIDSGAISALDRHYANRQLMQVASALAVYRTEHGSYPDSLDALVPKLLPKLPTDNYHGKPLVYRKTDNSYLLYNVGANGADDGAMNAQLSVYKGYYLNNNEATVAELLNEAEPIDSSEIPTGSDDWAIRFPLPQWDIPEVPRRGEKEDE